MLEFEDSSKRESAVRRAERGASEQHMVATAAARVRREERLVLLVVNNEDNRDSKVLVRDTRLCWFRLDIGQEDEEWRVEEGGGRRETAPNEAASRKRRVRREEFIRFNTDKLRTKNCIHTLGILFHEL